MTWRSTAIVDSYTRLRDTVPGNLKPRVNLRSGRLPIYLEKVSSRLLATVLALGAVCGWDPLLDPWAEPLVDPWADASVSNCSASARRASKDPLVDPWSALLLIDPWAGDE